MTTRRLILVVDSNVTMGRRLGHIMVSRDRANTFKSSLSFSSLLLPCLFLCIGTFFLPLGLMDEMSVVKREDVVMGEMLTLHDNKL